MTNSVEKQLITMQDLSAGVGETNQTRGGTNYQLGKVAVPYSVNSEAELANVDTSRFTLARVFGTEGTKDFEYTAGEWVEQLSVKDKDQDAAIDKLELLSRPVQLGDGVYALPDKEFTEVNQYLVDPSNTLAYTPKLGVVLPYSTNVLAYPTAVQDPNLQELSEYNELVTISISLNVPLASISYAIPGTTLVQYVRAADQQITYVVPAEAQGKLITSVAGGILVTADGASYKMPPATNRVQGLDTGIDVGDYANNPSIEESYEYVIADRTSEPTKWGVKEGVTLPYSISSAAYPKPYQDPNLQVFKSSAEIQAGLSYDAHSTLAAATSDVTAQVGMVVRIEDRGDGIFDWVTGETANGFDIIAHDSLSLQLKLRTPNGFVASQCGAVHGASDSAAVLSYIMTQPKYVIDGRYSVASTLTVQNATSGDMQDVIITALTDDFKVFSGTGKSRFEMTGNLKVKGPGMGVGTGIGIWFFDCYDYKMDCNPDVGYIGESIICDGTSITAGGLAGHRGRQGRWTNPTTHNCKKGIQTLRRAEYSLWSNPQVSQCTQIGWTNSAGNTNVIGGNIQDNANGVLLNDEGTTNGNHGMFTGVNINHNIGYNLRCEDVLNGHTFNGCHFYGDSALAGAIELISSNGINIVNGIIDAKIFIDGAYVNTTAASAWNRIAGNQINTTYTAFESTNSGRQKTIVTGNFHRTGDAWGYNDRALTSVQADTTGGTQTIADATNTVILFNNKRDDNRLQYDDATGIFTALFPQSITINFNLRLDISGGSFIDGFCSIELNNSPLIYKALTSTGVGGTLVTGDGSVYLALQGGETLAVKAFCNINAGTITVTPGRNNNIGVKSTC